MSPIDINEIYLKVERIYDRLDSQDKILNKLEPMVDDWYSKKNFWSSVKSKIGLWTGVIGLLTAATTLLSRSW